MLTMQAKTKNPNKPPLWPRPDKAETLPAQFTPSEVIEKIIEITEDPRYQVHRNTAIHDPAGGTGNFLLANLEYLQELTGKSDRALSLEAGLNQGFIHDLKRKGSNPSQANIEALSVALQVPLGELVATDLRQMAKIAVSAANRAIHGHVHLSPSEYAAVVMLRRQLETKAPPAAAPGEARDETAGRPLRNEVDFARAMPIEPGDRDLPVFGAVQGGFDGAEIDYENPVEYIERPASLRNVKNACACYVVDSSMEPRYFQGELVHVHPGVPVKAGDFVVVELHDHKGIVKRLLRRNDHFIELQQFNPAETLKLPRENVVGIYRIIGTAS
jgi:phage repressor protein C with HTH and peptisase S24 domain